MTKHIKKGLTPMKAKASGNAKRRYLFIDDRKIDVGPRKGKAGTVAPHQVVRKGQRTGVALIRGFSMRKTHKSKHLGFKGLEHKVELNERKAHPGYSSARIHYIGQATAGKIAREKKARGF